MRREDKLTKNNIIEMYKEEKEFCICISFLIAVIYAFTVFMVEVYK